MTDKKETFFKIHGKDIFIVMPAYNESQTIAKVMEELLPQGLQLVVIDDGSHDDTSNIVKKVQKNYPQQIRLYRHVINRGLGAAISTGLEACLLENPKVIVTFDADGQHHADDLIPVARPVIEDNADVVIGTRNFHEMPFSKQFGNNVMNLITQIFYGIKVADSQSGLRAFSKNAAEKMELNARDYGVSSEIIGEIKRKHLKLVEIPIETIYTDYSISKGTNTRVGLKILAKLIRNIFK